ncbi:hypothetical protein ACO1O0_002093 [Amphichorda felina]
MLSTQDLDYNHHTQQQPTTAPNTISPMPHRVQEAQLVQTSSEGSPATTSSPAMSSSTAPSSMAPSPTLPSAPASDATVVQALEIARESPDGGHDPTISKILEGALAHTWAKVQAHPDSYVMSRDEFSVFNYFQHRFVDNPTARLARKRYWDTASA